MLMAYIEAVNKLLRMVVFLRADSLSLATFDVELMLLLERVSIIPLLTVEKKQYIRR